MHGEPEGSLLLGSHQRHVRGESHRDVLPEHQPVRYLHGAALGKRRPRRDAGELRRGGEEGSAERVGEAVDGLRQAGEVLRAPLLVIRSHRGFDLRADDGLDEIGRDRGKADVVDPALGESRAASLHVRARGLPGPLLLLPEMQGRRVGVGESDRLRSSSLALLPRRGRVHHPRVGHYPLKEGEEGLGGGTILHHVAAAGLVVPGCGFAREELAVFGRDHEHQVGANGRAVVAHDVRPQLVDVHLPRALHGELLDRLGHRVGRLRRVL